MLFVWQLWEKEPSLWVNVCVCVCVSAAHTYSCKLNPVLHSTTFDSCTQENFTRFQGLSTLEAVSDASSGKVGVRVTGTAVPAVVLVA